MGEINQLSTGGTFGELALINNEPRKANVQSISDCYFAVLEKKDYIGMLRKYELRIFNQKLDFLNNLPFLKHYTQIQIRRIVHSFTVSNYIINQKVCSEGQKQAYIYIIKEGDFEVTRRKYIVNKKENKKKAIEQQNRKHIGPNNKGSHSEMGTKIIELQNKKISTELRVNTVCSGQIIGHNDFISKRPHTTTLKCLSQVGQVYKIKLEEFQFQFQRSQRSWEWITNNSIQIDRELNTFVQKATHDIIKYQKSSQVKSHKNSLCCASQSPTQKP